MSKKPLTASCLCGFVRWEVSGLLDGAPHDPPTVLDHLRMSHCHCSRCRKAHGSAYATYVVARFEALRITHGAEGIVRYKGEAGGSRPFCGRCGSKVPDGVQAGEYTGVPAGPFDDDIGLRPTSHIFVGSKAPWHDIHDALPRFDAYPPGLDDAVLPTRAPLDPPGAPRGSCLCGEVTYVMEGNPLRSRTCHCARCRKAGSAANITYLATALDGLRFTRGEEMLTTFAVPEAKFFKNVFCRRCGSSMPRVDRNRGIVVVPMGSFDDDPGIRPQRHIFVGSIAPWDAITDALPQDAEYPPS